MQALIKNHEYLLFYRNFKERSKIKIFMMLQLNEPFVHFGARTFTINYFIHLLMVPFETILESNISIKAYKKVEYLIPMFITYFLVRIRCRFDVHFSWEIYHNFLHFIITYSQLNLEVEHPWATFLPIIMTPIVNYVYFHIL